MLYNKQSTRVHKLLTHSLTHSLSLGFGHMQHEVRFMLANMQPCVTTTSLQDTSNDRLLSFTEQLVHFLYYPATTYCYGQWECVQQIATL